MKKPILPVLALACALAAPVAAQSPSRPAAPSPTALRFEIDPSHTRVTFTVRHMMVSDVDGRFNGVAGHIVLDTADIRRSSVDVTIDATTIDTAEPRRDNHLRSADFFDVANHPTIRFVSRGVGVEGDRYFMVGDLTLRGVTKEVRIPFELRGPVEVGRGRTVIGAEGSLRVDRHDYGVSWSRLTDNGGLVVGDEVDIRLRVEAVRRTES